MRRRRRPILLALVPLLLAAAPAASNDPSLNVVLRSNIDVYPGTNDVWGYSAPDGTELAIYGHRDGTSFVDATDPSNPVEIYHLPGPSSTWRDIKTYLHYAYIVTEGTSLGAGIQIVDLSDPLAPVHANTYTGSGYTAAHNLWIDTAAGVAYPCGSGPNGGYYVLSLADPVNPTHLGHFGSGLHDMFVRDGLAYNAVIFAGRLDVVDVSDPTDPVTLATHSYPGGFTHNTWTNEAATHCMTTDEIGGGHLRVWDISDLGNITLASEYEVPSAIIHNVLAKDDMAYIAYYSAGSRLVDITDPTAPVEVGVFDTSPASGAGFNGAWGIYPFRDDDIYYVSDRQQGLFILEFTGGFAGDISGTVTDGSGTPLQGARVDLDGIFLTTDANGDYDSSVSGREYEAITTLFGYGPDTTIVTVPEHGSLVHDVVLELIPRGTVELRLVEFGTELPVEGAIVEILNAPISGLVTDENGEVTIADLPADLSWTARCGKFGYALTDGEIVATVHGVNHFQLALAPGFADDFEADQAWVSGAPDDDATDGLWERAQPVGSYYQGIVGPDGDATTGAGTGFAFVTESHLDGSYVGTSDVDGGKTTLLSPVFDATSLTSMTLTYQRWFSNRAPAQDDDEFRADVSTDGGATWTNLETIAFGTDSWASVVIDLDAVVGPTDQMRLRFVAEDSDPETFVEAGVDDVQIHTTPVGVGDFAQLPAVPALAPPAPNPFRESTTFEFQVPTAGRVALDVFDVTGRRVSRLVQAERMAAGTHRVNWDGRDTSGRTVAPGIYFAKLIAGNVTATRKVTLVR